MVKHRPVTPRRRKFGEIKRPTPPPVWCPGDHRFVDTGALPLGRVGDLGGDRADIDRRIGQQVKGGADHRRFQHRQIALNVDHRVMAAVGVDAFQGFENTVRARRMIGAG